MVVHGEKSKIRHKNMTDGVAENGGQKNNKNIRININKKLKKQWITKKNKKRVSKIKKGVK